MPLGDRMWAENLPLIHTQGLPANLNVFITHEYNGLKKKKEAAIKLYESIPGNKYLITLAKL